MLKELVTLWQLCHDPDSDLPDDERENIADFADVVIAFGITSGKFRKLLRDCHAAGTEAPAICWQIARQLRTLQKLGIALSPEALARLLLAAAGQQ